MIIGTLKEKKKFENRVAISPDEVKSYLKSGHQVLIEKGAGSLSGFTDKSYKEAGATITNSKEVLKTSEIINNGINLWRIGDGTNWNLGINNSRNLK